jgi:hypothetical protein
VVAVASVKDRVLTLKGVEPGVAEIEVTAKDESGAELVDKMFFHVAKPAAHRIEHACTEAADAAYVRGDDIDVFHRLATSDNRPLVGYDYAPLKIDPPRALELVAQPQGSALYRFRAPSPQARVTLRSTIDEKTLGFRIVDRGELGEAHLDVPPSLLENETSYVVASVKLGETPLCSQNALTKAKSLTPEICRVTARLEDGTDDSNRDQLALISALKFGICKFEVTLPELARGRGVVLAGEVKVGQVRFPGEGNRSWSEWFRTALMTRETVGVVFLVGWLAWRRRSRRVEDRP